MKVSIHAGQRFLERVMSKTSYTPFDINFAIGYLEKLLADVVIIGKSKHFVLPCFHDFKVVYADGTVVTIIPKRDNYAK